MQGLVISQFSEIVLSIVRVTSMVEQLELYHRINKGKEFPASIACWDTQSEAQVIKHVFLAIWTLSMFHLPNSGQEQCCLCDMLTYETSEEFCECKCMAWSHSLVSKILECYLVNYSYRPSYLRRKGKK